MLEDQLYLKSFIGSVQLTLSELEAKLSSSERSNDPKNRSQNSPSVPNSVCEPAGWMKWIETFNCFMVVLERA